MPTAAPVSPPHQAAAATNIRKMTILARAMRNMTVWRLAAISVTLNTLFNRKGTVCQARIWTRGTALAYSGKPKRRLTIHQALSAMTRAKVPESTSP